MRRAPLALAAAAALALVGCDGATETTDDPEETIEDRLSDE